MGKLTVYSQLTANPSECFAVLKREIGLQTGCIPFANKLIKELKTLSIKSEYDSYNASNVLLSGLQTLAQGGIVPEDYDKIDFVKRGNTIVPSARVEAFLRAAARKGYRITDTIVPVPQDDLCTTYFEENFYNGDIVYILKDARKNPDRAVTAERLVRKYFAKFLCRLDIHDVQKNVRVAMIACEMPIDDILEVAKTSEQGLYKSEWVVEDTPYGPKKRKIITDELNTGTFWIKWTGEMVNKTIIRRALKRVKEVLPELQDSIYAFEQDDYVEPPEKEQPTIVVPLDEPQENIDLEHLNKEQVAECKEVYDLFVANPKLADNKTDEIIAMFENGIDKQEIINAEYAYIFCLKKSTPRWEKLRGYFDA
ncbi:MAG: hypothetical protein UIM24_05655 [Clostridia bacterium]|nr:hypothetical protein [Clostridia bacterium]